MSLGCPGLPEVGNKVSMLSKVCAEFFNSIMHLLREALLALSSGADRQHDLLYAQKQVILLLLGTLLAQISEP